MKPRIRKLAIAAVVLSASLALTDWAAARGLQQAGAARQWGPAIAQEHTAGGAQTAQRIQRRDGSYRTDSSGKQVRRRVSGRGRSQGIAGSRMRSSQP